MYHLNEQELKAMVSQKHTSFHAQSQQARLLNSVPSQKEASAVVVNPVRRKVGFLLMRWGMQLAGLAK